MCHTDLLQEIIKAGNIIECKNKTNQMYRE